MGNKNSRTLEGIRSGRFQAIEAPRIRVSPTFWVRWIRRRPRKTLAGQLEFIHQDDTYYFFGVMTHKLFSDDLIVHEFYRIYKEDLDKEYPVWRRGSGIELKNTCYTAVQEARAGLPEVTADNERVQNVTLDFGRTKLNADHVEALVHVDIAQTVKAEHSDADMTRETWRVILYFDPDAINSTERYPFRIGECTRTSSALM